MDWTLTGASPPTSTLPTFNCLLLRLGDKTGGGAAGIPKSTMALFCLKFGKLQIEVDWIENVRSEQHQG